MNRFHTRAVFFTSNASAALDFYVDKLGFNVDWRHDESGVAFIFQASLNGLELIINQFDEGTADRPGRGRVFVGLDADQTSPLIDHIRLKNIKYELLSWGKPTLVIRDLDRNEMFFWPPEDDWGQLFSEA